MSKFEQRIFKQNWNKIAKILEEKYFFKNVPYLEANGYCNGISFTLADYVKNCREARFHQVYQLICQTEPEELAEVMALQAKRNELQTKKEALDTFAKTQNFKVEDFQNLKGQIEEIDRKLKNKINAELYKDIFDITSKIMHNQINEDYKYDNEITKRLTESWGESLLDTFEVKKYLTSEFNYTNHLKIDNSLDMSFENYGIVKPSTESFNTFFSNFIKKTISSNVAFRLFVRATGKDRFFKMCALDNVNSTINLSYNTPKEDRVVNEVKQFDNTTEDIDALVKHVNTIIKPDSLINLHTTTFDHGKMEFESKDFYPNNSSSFKGLQDALVTLNENESIDFSLNWPTSEKEHSVLVYKIDGYLHFFDSNCGKSLILPNVDEVLGEIIYTLNKLLIATSPDYKKKKFEKLELSQKLLSDKQTIRWSKITACPVKLDKSEIVSASQPSDRINEDVKVPQAPASTRKTFAELAKSKPYKIVNQKFSTEKTLTTDELKKITKKYIEYKNNRFFGLSWLCMSNATMQLHEDFQTAKSDEARFKLAEAYLSNNPNTAFGKFLKDKLPALRKPLSLKCLIG